MSQILYLGLGFYLHKKLGNFLDIFNIFSKSHKIKTSRVDIKSLRYCSLEMDTKKYHTRFHRDIYDSFLRYPC